MPPPARTLGGMARSSSSPIPGVGTVMALMAGFVATSMLAGLLVAGLFIPAVGASGTVARGGVEFFDSLPEDLEVGTLSQQSRILWADGTPMAAFYYENRVLVPLSQVAPVMRQAVIAIEDSRFYEHNGADPQGIARAMLNNAQGGGTQGASTLTQQWIKNVLLDQAIAADDKEQIQALQNPDKGRKIREIKLALSAEKEYTKDQILENYLNIALFGDGQYGIQTAALHFLSKSAADLSLQDAALLAGMINSPTYNNPVDFPERAQERRDTVLARMLSLGMIDQAQHDAAAAVPLAEQLNVSDVQNGCAAAGSAAFFCSYVVKILLNDPAFGDDLAARQRLLYRGGLTISTTLDPAKQALAQKAVDSRVPATDASGVGVALSSVESGTGRIVAMAQNRVFNPKEEPIPGGTSINYNVDKAYGGGVGFQPGSNYKPFTLATWLEAGNSLNERVSANKRTYIPNKDFKSSCAQLGTTPYSPANSEGRDKGNITVLQATYSSVNTAYMDMASQLDLCDIRDTAVSLGVHRADGADLSLTPSSVLGANEVAPLTMAAAYAAFAKDGVYCKPIAISSVTKPGGTTLAKPESECQQALDPEVARGVAYALSQTVLKGTARGTNIGVPSAGKTGTTNQSSETWFTGFTPGGLSTSVWVGTPNTKPSSLNGLTIKGRKYRAVYGATLALPTWEAYMTGAMKGAEARNFPRPSEKLEFGNTKAVPDVAGKSSAEAVSILRAAGFKATTQTPSKSSLPAGTAYATTPAAGSRAAPGTTVTIKVSRGPSGGTGGDNGGGGDGGGPGGGQGGGGNTPPVEPSN